MLSTAWDQSTDCAGPSDDSLYCTPITVSVQQLQPYGISISLNKYTHTHTAVVAMHYNTLLILSNLHSAGDIET